MRVAGFDERTITNKPGAEQGSRLRIGIKSGDWETESMIRDGVFGITAVQRVTGEQRAVAKIFATGIAILANATGPAQPGHADASADFEIHDFVSNGGNMADDFV